MLTKKLKDHAYASNNQCTFADQIPQQHQMLRSENRFQPRHSFLRQHEIQSFLHRFRSGEISR